MSLENLFDQYLKAGLYLKGWSPKTVVIYKRAFTSFQKSLRGGELNAHESHSESGSQDRTGITKTHLEAWVISRREAGMSPEGINIYIRAMNSFSAWLKAEGYADQVILQQLRSPKKLVVVLEPSDVRAIMAFKPCRLSQLRLWALVQLLLDTGCRIDELIGLPVSNVDFANLLITVDGKGSRQRKVPFSHEARKPVWRWCEAAKRKGINWRWLFCTRNGTKVSYDNTYRDIRRMCRMAGITKRVHPHLFRHTFSCHFMRSGGSIYTLSRILGHSSVSTTQIYVRGLGVEDFREEQARLSPLARLR